MSTETKPQAKALSPIEAFKLDVQKMEPQFATMLPSHIPPARFVRVLQTIAQLRPEIASADRRMLWGEAMKCAQDGLVPDGREATINTYRAKDGTVVPKYIPMVAGLAKKARNSGEISTIDALVVYEKDTYEAWVDEKGQHFKHVKARGDRGNVVLTYAYAITKDGGFYFEEIDEEQMAAIEQSSRAKDGPWKGPFKDEMRRKSGIRRLTKYRLPSSADLDTLIQRDEDLFLPPEQESAAPVPATTKPSRLGKIIDAQATKVETAPTEAERTPTDDNNEVPI